MPRRVHRRPFYEQRPFNAHTPDRLELWVRDRSVAHNGPVGIQILAEGWEAEGEFDVTILGPNVTVKTAENGQVILHVRSPKPNPQAKP